MPRPKRSLPATGKLKPITARQDQFCREYLLDLNATQAAIRAGFSPKNAPSISSRLLAQPEINARITALRDERNARLSMDADDVVKRLIGVVVADPRKLTAHHIGACRYCWGIGHAYQWRHERELAEAIRKVKDDNEPPSSVGGFGYSRAKRPNPDCPDCDGYGIGFTVFADTRDLDDEGMRLFHGVKTTRDGLTVLMADKNKALERLADHFGIYDRRDENTANAFTDMVSQLLRAGGPHTRAPIRKDPEPGEGK
jgi:hypothetical protein